MSMTEKRAARKADQPRWSLDFHGIDFNVRVTPDNVVKGKDGGPVKGATATVQSEGEIRDRFTATRILALGVFALAFKKKTSDRDVFLTIEGEGFLTTRHVRSKDEAKARAFARQFNTYAASLD